MLIAESGSTKTEWRLCREGKVVNAFRSRGFNPNVMPAETILKELAVLQKTHLSAATPGKIFFYGAGTRGEAQNRIMADIFRNLFPLAEIIIGYDLLAAARSTGRPEGIACILGTGSSACRHKNYEIEEIRGGLGYLFGDEGSGADLGRNLVKAILQKDFPPEVAAFVEEKEGMGIHDLKMAITRHPKPNVRMAVLAPYLQEFLAIPEVFAQVSERFGLFLDTTVRRIPDYFDLPVDIIGSIGYYFSKPFAEACILRNITPGKFIKDPIDPLVDYHLAHS
ncbi:MAG: hypothetical protein SF052_10800 [Bacteroidia bacterium]|nr:hypothetical protein [Bacteroidia bacterium]